MPDTILTLALAPDTAPLTPAPAPGVQAGPLTPTAACVVCGDTPRWPDGVVWRCSRCWPAPLTDAARQAEAQPVPALALRADPAPAVPVPGPRRPPFMCPKCKKPSTWLIRGTAWVCYRCAHAIEQEEEA